MAKIVGIHGIGHQLQGENTIYSRWLPALKDGLLRAGISSFNDTDLRCAFYGDLFRPQPGFTKGFGEPLYDATDISDPWEKDFLEQLSNAVSTNAADESTPTAQAKGISFGRAPNFVQRSLDTLSQSKFFAGIAERVMIADLKQVYLYLNDPQVRSEVQQRITAAVTADTRMIIGHSLGSVVAYEAVANNPQWQIETLVTLGSPLGISNLIFDKLNPAPHAGVGVWPAGLKRWSNIADGGDIVALVKQLSSRFGAQVQDRLIYNGATAHNIEPYFTAKETGEAIASGLHN